MSAETNLSHKAVGQASKDEMAPVPFFDFSMHHILRNPNWRTFMRMLVRREDRLEDLTDAKTAMLIQRAMLLKFSTAEEWQRWQADQTLFRDMYNESGPFKLDAQRVERLGVSFLEKRAFELVQTGSLQIRGESGFGAKTEEWVKELSSEVVLLLTAGDRHGLWSLQVDDAPEGQMVAGSHYWTTRAAIALNAACSPGVVLSRFVESQEAGVLGHQVTLNVGNVFTTSDSRATISVFDMFNSASKRAEERGGCRIHGLSGRCFSLRAVYGVEDGQLIKRYGVGREIVPEMVGHLVTEMRECALQGPAPEILIAEALDSLVPELHFFEPDEPTESDQSVDEEIADLRTISQGLRSMAFNHTLEGDDAERFKHALDGVGRDVYVIPTCVDPSIDMTGVEESLRERGNLLSMARTAFEESQADAPSMKDDLLRYIAESKPDQGQTM